MRQLGDIDPDSIVDVINKAGDMVLRPAGKKEVETSEEAEASDKGRSLAKSTLSIDLGRMNCLTAKELGGYL